MEPLLYLAPAPYCSIWCTLPRLMACLESKIHWYSFSGQRHLHVSLLLAKEEKMSLDELALVVYLARWTEHRTEAQDEEAVVCTSAVEFLDEELGQLGYARKQQAVRLFGRREELLGSLKIP